MTTTYLRRTGIGLAAVVATTTALAASPAAGDEDPAGSRSWRPREVVSEDDAPRTDILAPDYYRVVTGPHGGVTAAWVRERQPAGLRLSHRAPGCRPTLAATSSSPASTRAIHIDCSPSDGPRARRTRIRSA